MSRVHTCNCARISVRCFIQSGCVCDTCTQALSLSFRMLLLPMNMHEDDGERQQSAAAIVLSGGGEREAVNCCDKLQQLLHSACVSFHRSFSFSMLFPLPLPLLRRRATTTTTTKPSRQRLPFSWKSLSLTLCLSLSFALSFHPYPLLHMFAYTHACSRYMYDLPGVNLCVGDC